MTTDAHRRPVRSYVLRAGRMTVAQERALATLMPRYGLALAALAAPAQCFGRHAPLFLEIGIGNGDNIVAMAEHRPAADYLGCEVHRPGLGHTLNAIAERSLHNLRLVEHDAHAVLAALPAHVLDGVYLFFPDPWPKKRHHKRRLLNTEFLALLHTRLKPQGGFFFATDDADYAGSALELVSAAPDWLNIAGPSHYAPRPHLRILTRFELRAQYAGRAIRDIIAMPSSRRHD
jgi:tRNA (guanine-N7-)-methyltransferase